MASSAALRFTSSACRSRPRGHVHRSRSACGARGHASVVRGSLQQVRTLACPCWCGQRVLPKGACPRAGWLHHPHAHKRQEQEHKDEHERGPTLAAALALALAFGVAPILLDVIHTPRCVGLGVLRVIPAGVDEARTLISKRCRYAYYTQDAGQQAVPETSAGPAVLRRDRRIYLLWITLTTRTHTHTHPLSHTHTGTKNHTEGDARTARPHPHPHPLTNNTHPHPHPLTNKGGNIFRVGVFLDYVRLTTRTPHGGCIVRAESQTKSNRTLSG